MQRAMGVAVMVDAHPTTALFLVGPRGSGKSSFCDAIRMTVGVGNCQVASQASIEGVDAGTFTNSAQWPECAMLFVDEFELDRKGAMTKSPTMYKLCTGEPINTRSMRNMPESEDVACQLVLMGLQRPGTDRMPDAICRRVQVITKIPRYRQTQVNKSAATSPTSVPTP